MQIAYFELVVLGGSTVDELFVALCCVSVAALIPKIHLRKVQEYTHGALMFTDIIMACNPSFIISVNMVMA